MHEMYSFIELFNMFLKMPAMPGQAGNRTLPTVILSAAKNLLLAARDSSLRSE